MLCCVFGRPQSKGYGGFWTQAFAISYDGSKAESSFLSADSWKLLRRTTCKFSGRYKSAGINSFLCSKECVLSQSLPRLLVSLVSILENSWCVDKACTEKHNLCRSAISQILFNMAKARNGQSKKFICLDSNELGLRAVMSTCRDRWR